MQAVRGWSERVEWRSKSHLNLWPEHSRNRLPITRKVPLAAVSDFPGSSQRISRSRFRLTNSTWTRRNFSSRARELSGGDTIILSIPKSGRTWLRAFLCAYFCRRFGLEFTLRPGRYDLPGFPRIVFSHDLFEHRTKGDRWDRIRGKYLVPRRELKRAKIILLARDPRDCFVSLYLQLTRRDPNAPVKLRQRTVSEMLRDQKFGMGAIINAMNDWLNEFSQRDNFNLVRYEALRASPAEHFRDLLAVLGESQPDAYDLPGRTRVFPLREHAKAGGCWGV